MPHKYVKRGALALGLLATSAMLQVVVATASPPIDIKLVMSKPLYSVFDDIHGTMTVSWPNGTHISSAAISVTQRPSTFGSMFGSTVSGPSDATGRFAFSFADDGSDVGSIMPGHHDLIVVVTANDITTRQLFGYTVSVTSL